MVKQTVTPVPAPSLTPTPLPVQPPKSSKWWLWVVLIIIVVAVTIFFLTRGKKTSHNQGQAQPTKTFILDTTSSPTTVVAAHNTTGFNMLKLLYEQTSTETNVSISPLSISQALNMAYLGAAAKTKTEMATALGLTKLSDDQIRNETQPLMQQLASVSADGYELDIANGAWLKSDITIKDSYLQQAKQYFQSEVLNLPAQNGGAKINEWVSAKTKAKIPTIVDASLNPDFALTNAVYFKGKWADIFDKNLTDNREFTFTSGSKIQTPFMVQKNTWMYAENDFYQLASLPYISAENQAPLEAIVLLPKKSLNEVLTKVTGDNWSNWLAKLQDREGTIWLPKFEIGSDYDLIPPLKKMGIKAAFVVDQANFSAISDVSLYIYLVKHKTYMKTDELGTEAAAATVIGAMPTSTGPRVEPEKPFEMIVDHPFIFAIRDHHSGELIFLTIIQNPSATTATTK